MKLPTPQNNAGPLPLYLAKLDEAGFVADQAQRAAVERLQMLFDRLSTYRRVASGRALWLRWLRRGQPQPPQGVYLWGGVGRGKTFLMDMFYESLPADRKMRTHFHRFMRRVHAELTHLKGTKNPLDQVAQTLSKEASVICFDEFFVADITDAMILANLLRALFDRGVTLVATSNIVPQDLYKDGLQRERFVPAIDLLLQHMDVVNVDSGTDYRLRALTRAELFYSPLNGASSAAMEQCFQSLVMDGAHVETPAQLEIEQRVIHAKKEADDVVWFEFRALCEGPRSQNDYIVLAKEYHTVLLSDVPQLGAQNEDQARRFIYLVDEFYDRSVKLIVSAAAPIEQLYQHGKLKFEFARTISRLREMQSAEYLALPHRP